MNGLFLRSVALASATVVPADEGSRDMHGTVSAIVLPSEAADQFQDAQSMPRLSPDVAVVANGNECL